MEICFATNNENKLFEIVHFLKNTPFQVKSLKDIGCHEDIAETADTIEGNSLIKAQYVFDNYQIPCFEDDTGLEVESLNGDPGIYSARYAGPQRSSQDNNQLLLQNLENSQNRQARFKTAISWVSETEKEQFIGIVNGEILSELKGIDGFGYDPLFRPKGFEKTFAEMDVTQKNTISHRALATRKLIDYLTNKK